MYPYFSISNFYKSENRKEIWNIFFTMLIALKKYLSPFPKQKKIALKGFAVYLSHVLYNLIAVYFLAKITQYLEAWDSILLYTILWIYLGVVIVFNVFFYIWRNWTRTDISPAYRKTLQSIYIPKFISLDTTYVEKIGTWKIISIIKEWTYQWAKSLEKIIDVWTQITATLIYMIAVFRSVWYIYMVWFLVILVGCLFFAQYCNKQIIAAREMRINASHWYSKQLVKIIMSKNEIMQSEKTLIETEKLNDYNDEYTKYSRLTNPWLHWFFFVPRITFDLWRILLFGYAWRVVISTWWSISEIILLWWWLIYLDQTVVKALSFYKDATRDFDYVKKMRDFFEEWKTEINYTEWKDFIYNGWTIELKNVWFGYTEETVLDGLSLTIVWNKKTALVWASGAGKSTIVKLIAWYIRPDSGVLSVDGQDLSKVSLKSYYKHIWYLTQEASVFDGTIRENLLYAVDKDSSLHSEWQLDQAIKSAKCEFIYKFPDGLDTEIGERWIRLSGWQRQRLAIAKIFIKNPKIIILDEPTSALDSFSEEAITQAMNELFVWRTVIIIAHRLQTVKHADDIILLDEWQILERGTHSELVKLWGQYAKMLELQSWF